MTVINNLADQNRYELITRVTRIVRFAPLHQSRYDVESTVPPTL
jgi:hypothetical protein